MLKTQGSPWEIQEQMIYFDDWGKDLTPSIRDTSYLLLHWTCPQLVQTDAYSKVDDEMASGCIVLSSMMSPSDRVFPPHWVCITRWCLSILRWAELRCNYVWYLVRSRAFSPYDSCHSSNVLKSNVIALMTQRSSRAETSEHDISFIIPFYIFVSVEKQKQP